MRSSQPYLMDVSRLIWRRWAGRYPTGIDRVCLAYLDHFHDRTQGVVQYRGKHRILQPEASAWLLKLLREPGDDFRREFVTGFLRYAIKRQDRGQGRLYLNIGHTGLDQDGFGQWAKEADVRPVYFVHDLIPITHPQFCRPREEGRHQRRMTTVLDTAAGVIGNSQATLDDLTAFAASKGASVPPMIAAWLGIDLPARPPSPLHPNPTFVAVSTLEARKNYMFLLDLWARLLQHPWSVPPKLILIGQRGWENEDVFARLDNDDQLRGHVVELGNCSDAEMTKHLSEAAALLFPTLAEGFGLPLVEALANGTPVIASDLPVFREIGQGVPTLLPVNDFGAWEDEILSYADPEGSRRPAQLENIRAFRPFRWTDHFAVVEPWLSTL